MFTNTAVHKIRRLSMRIGNRRMVIWLAIVLLSMCGVGPSTVGAESVANLSAQQKALSSLLDSANLAKKANDPRKALALMEQCLPLANELYGSESRSTAASLNGLGLLYLELGQYGQALPLLKQALAIHEKVLGPNHFDIANSLTNLAGVYYQVGQYDQALPLLKRSLAINEKTLGPGNKSTAASLNFLGLLYIQLGQYDQALPMHQRALAINEKTLGPDHPNIANTLNALAGLFKILGQYDQALPLQQRALAINEKALGPDHYITANTLQNLADLYEILGQYDQALPFYQRSLAINEKALGPFHPDTATSLNNLAGLFKILGQYDQALPFYQRSLAIFEKTLGPDHPYTAASLTNLGQLYIQLGQYDQALPLHQRALAINEKTLGPDHPGTAISLNNLAVMYLTLDRSDKALPLLERAYQISIHAGVPQVSALLQGNLRDFYAEEQPSMAIFYGKQAVNTIQGLRHGSAKLDKTMQESFLKKNEDTYQELASLLVDSGRLSEAQQVLAMLKEEEQHAFVQRDATADVGDTRASLAPIEAYWQQRYQEIADSIMALGVEYRSLQKRAEQGILSAAEDKRLLAIFADLDVAERAFHQTLDAMKDAFKDAKTESRRSELDRKKLDESLTGVVGELGEGTVLVHTIVLEDGLRLILTSGDTRKAYKVEVTEKEINQAVHQLLQALRDPLVDPRPGAKALYDWLIQPMAADLSQLQPKTLMFSLDGVLRYVPMAALYDGKQYLAELYGVALYTTVGRENLKDEPKANWRVAGMGVSKAHVGFKALSGVEDELNGIVRSGQSDDTGVLPGDIALDQDFTQAKIRQELIRKPSVVHLASHFSLNPGTEQASFLLLGDGTHLSLAELRKGRYPFGAVDLVTLSACETATTGGKGSEIEGMAGIVQRKGAKSVLATLWPVADSSTAQFMQHFYRIREQENLSKTEALRQTQLAMLSGELGGPGDKRQRGGGLRDQQGLPISKGVAFANAANFPWAHPYYWAPFVLMGNWR